jgi:hypothetical protein
VASRDHLLALIRWDPVPGEREAVSVERFLPSLDGELGLHAEPGGVSTLVLDARYQPPGRGTRSVGRSTRCPAPGRTQHRGTVRRDVAAALAAEATLYAVPMQAGSQAAHG